MMMLNVARKVPLMIKDNFPLNFGSDFQTYQGMNLKGKKAGIIGLGNIGTAIAARCQGLGMDVSYWNRSSKNNTYTASELKTLLTQSDVIFPCIADNDETKKIITDDMLRSIRSDAMVISLVHKYYNHHLLIDRVAKNDLYGYGFEAEPASFLKYTGNVWAAPAYAWCTDGSLRSAMDLFVEAIVNAAQGRYPHQVNA